jgi:hypothetical protein
MPRIYLRIPEDTPEHRVKSLIDSLEGKVAKEFSVDVEQIGTLLFPYTKLSRPCEPISVTIVGLDRRGRAERLQGIVNEIIDRHPWIKELPKRHREWIDLDFDRRAEEDWVAA